MHRRDVTRIPGVAMQVIDRSRKLWSEEADKAALRERTSFVAGDFFKGGALRICVRQAYAVCAASRTQDMQVTDGSMCFALPGRLSAALVKLAALPCARDRRVCLVQFSTCKCVLTDYRLILINLFRQCARSSPFYSKHIMG